MLSVEAFRPAPNGTVQISASSSNATAALTTAILTNIGIRIHNAGPATVFVEFGGSAAVTAVTTTSLPLPVGAIEILNIDQSTWAAAITASGTATVYFSAGYGL